MIAIYAGRGAVLEVDLPHAVQGFWSVAEIRCIMGWATGLAPAHPPQVNLEEILET